MAIDRRLHYANGVHEPVQSQFKKVRRLSHPEGALEISAGKNYADDLRRHFGRESRRSSMRSTYFASRSNSRFTKSPLFAVARFVCARVWGMIQAAKLFGETSATVRLIPFKAMDPL